MGEEPRFVFKTCCCGVSLRKGSLIIAIVSVVLELIGAIGGIYMGAFRGREEGWVNLAIELINFGLAALLVHGIRVTRQDLVFLWVWGSTIMMGLTLVVGILMLVYAKTIIGSIIMIAMLSVQIYFILVVRSYAHVMGDPAILPA